MEQQQGTLFDSEAPQGDLFSPDGRAFRQQLQTVQQQDQDFEWYPTTREILAVVAQDIRREFKELGDREPWFSLLDVGAGNGSAIRILRELTGSQGDDYAVEKSRPLIDAMPAGIFVIGTDFHQQTLIDKRVDVLFCNPPYREYSEWVRRIIHEANADFLYLVIPERWRDDAAVMQTLRKRCRLDDESEPQDDPGYRRGRGIYRVLSRLSFLDSEFRQSRANVEVVKIRFKTEFNRTKELDVDPFDLWFEQSFRINADATRYVRDSERSAERLHELVAGSNVIERLDQLYRQAFDKLLAVYKTLEQLDRELFKELGVNLQDVRSGLKQKIAGLKNLYWRELFDNLDAITSRLTQASRKRLLDKLTANTSVDFSAANAYAVVMWAIKNSNQYFDDQLKELYFALAERENIRNYRSNKRLIEDGWRYQRKDMTHFTLDYRLVINRYRCFNPEPPYGDYEYPKGLHTGAHDFLNDIRTVAQNLGFSCSTDSRDLCWEPGKLQEFRTPAGDLFMDVRAYKKGTLHIRVDQTFMKKLNIEAARLNRWVKDPEEAAQETGIPEAQQHWGVNYKLSSIKLISGGAA